MIGLELYTSSIYEVLRTIFARTESLLRVLVSYKKSSYHTYSSMSFMQTHQHHRFYKTVLV